jgi:hypothetical protein
MIRSATFKLTFTWEDEVSVTVQKEDGIIRAFSVNYRTKVDEKWCDVIRYDTSHGMIHAHKFWISSKIIPLRELTEMDMKMAIIEAIGDIKMNWERYKSYLIKKVKGNEK